MENNEWKIIPSFTRGTHSNEAVTIRINPTASKKLSVRVSLGTVVCNLVGFRQADRVQIFHSKKNENLFLIKKSESNDGHKLSFTNSPGSNYLTFDFIIPNNNIFRIRETIRVDFDFEKNNLFIDLTKVRRNK